VKATGFCSNYGELIVHVLSAAIVSIRPRSVPGEHGEQVAVLKLKSFPADEIPPLRPPWIRPARPHPSGCRRTSGPLRVVPPNSCVLVFHLASSQAFLGLIPPPAWCWLISLAALLC